VLEPADEMIGPGASFENIGGRTSVSSSKAARSCVIPAWNAGIQVDTDVSGSIRANLINAGCRCRHDEVCILIVCGKRKIMNQCVVIFGCGSAALG